MRALRWDGTRLALARDVADPAPGPGEALVRVQLAGICRTDLELVRGYLGFRGIPGHEWVGRVVASDDPSFADRRVVGEINLACRIRRVVEGRSRSITPAPPWRAGPRRPAPPRAGGSAAR